MVIVVIMITEWSILSIGDQLRRKTLPFPSMQSLCLLSLSLSLLKLLLAMFAKFTGFLTLLIADILGKKWSLPSPSVIKTNTKAIESHLILVSISSRIIIICPPQFIVRKKMTAGISGLGHHCFWPTGIGSGILPSRFVFYIDCALFSLLWNKLMSHR